MFETKKTTNQPNKTQTKLINVKDIINWNITMYLLIYHEKKNNLCPDNLNSDM